MGRWLRHCSGGVGLRSERPGITGGHGAVGVVGPVAPPGRASPVLSPAARVRAPAGSVCQGQRSVHRLAKMASWSCFGPFVYTVAPLWTDVGTQECTPIGENGLLAPFWGIRVHCCDARIVRAAMRVATRTVSGGTSGSNAMVCRRRPPVVASPLSGRQALCDRLCASAAASLASLPRQQPMQTPEEPFVFCLVVEALVPPQGARTPCAARPRGPPRGRDAARRAR